MENEIRDFFRATTPQPGDGTAFRLELNARLAAAEQIRQYREREERRLRRLAWVVFAAGLALGGAVAALLILKPFGLAELFAGSTLADTLIPGLPGYFLWILAAFPIACLAFYLPIKLSRRKQII